jgi:hypothetical protein
LSPNDPQAATLMDKRDSALGQLAKLVDVRTVTDSSNQVSVFTNSGIQLVSNGLASEFTIASPGTLNASALYNANPAKSGVSTLNIRLPNGASLDVVANNVISSGQIAAGNVLDDHVRRPLVLAEIEDVEDVWVAHARNRLCLVPEARYGVLVRRDRVHDFDGAGASELLVVGAVDRAHSALAYELLDLVLPQLGSRLDRHGA